MTDILKQKIVDYLNASTEEKLELYLSYIKSCNLTKEERHKLSMKKYRQSQKGIMAHRKANRKYYEKKKLERQIIN
tara:strand:+ start:123 stop:350 length:228 start_codon:yes stop_codon:yes gene_type:complete